MPAAEWSQVPARLVDAVVTAVHRREWPLLLTGAQGRGKTCAAACVFRSWPASPARWADAAGLLQQIAQARGNGGWTSRRLPDGRTVDDHESAIVERLAGARLLVLDDVGSRTLTDARFEILLHILNSRAGRPTVVTSNLQPRELADALDGRIASRLLAGTVVRVTGPDRRVTGKQAIEA